MVICDFDDFGFCMPKFEFSKEPSQSFSFTIENTIFLAAMDPVCYFLSLQHYITTQYIKEDYRAKESLKNSQI
jgi:hypothetical protein